ncbi:uncharacterized protein LOC133289066 isoform X1 [Gastrolobium bilobum]|uniref:uncharacterized protein LOC133289066 isoform X1 n=1 Tax=Gastrolobium bilobum TaxID=150636 RepID=UPI002AB2F1B1|nr:uncharacterized protein LOC133289066 isoform X1 [Gastrolobium bilobum]XP_061342918.1 uncharacterized protein LOC133289066 isoform X1 [Gastrolobium bilobum]
MSVACGVECVFVLGCARWLWKRCTYIGSYDSATWPSATADEFEPAPRVCRLILAIYEPDLLQPQHYQPAGGYRLNPDWVVKRVTYEDTLGHAPPYIIYVDHDHREIVLAVRGLNLVKESDYKLLLDNSLGKQMFDGGYVHHGLLKSATWLLNRESETLKQLWVENGSEYGMVFAGHSLGSGVVSLLTILVVNHREKLGGIPKEKIRCYAIAPARCMSLNLAVKYANVIHSIVLQDDFLPRTPTPLEDIFKSVFCLPCLLFLVCLRDTFIPEGRKLRDPRRLYAPGRMYHIVERKFCRCGRFPPEVRTAIPVEGRFEHIVLSCNTTSDHGIVWIQREAEKALQLMKDHSSETVTVPPTVQKFERLKTIEKEHKDALERAVSLNVPHAVDTAEKEPSANNEGEASSSGAKDPSSTQSKSSGARANWDEVVEKLLKKNETADPHLERDTNVPQ